MVVGIVVDIRPDGFLLDLVSCTRRAYVLRSAFEGASGKVAMDVQVADVIYGRITRCEASDAELDMSCVTHAGDGEGFGILGNHKRSIGAAVGGDVTTDDGTASSQAHGSRATGPNAVSTIVRVRSHVVRLLLSRTSPLMVPCVKRHIPLEIAVGENGLVWVRARRIPVLIAFTLCCELGDRMPQGDVAEHDELANRVGTIMDAVLPPADVEDQAGSHVPSASTADDQASDDRDEVEDETSDDG